MTTCNIVKKSTLFNHIISTDILHRALRLMLLTVVTLCVLMPAAAHDPAKYAATSVLADGKWGKVKVTQTGMQFVSAATLRQLGFDDPVKVNVYGFGGRLLPDELSASDPDDLPLLPSIATSAGLWFFGHSHVGWNLDKGEYQHVTHPYAEESWYFLSDRTADSVQLPDAALPASAEAESSAFTQMILHEQDLYHPSTSGRIYLGEDFRATPNRKFNFSLTDKASDAYTFKASFGNKASMTTTFAVKPTGGDEVTVNMKALANAQGEFDDTYLLTATVTGSGSSTAEDITLDISYKAAGTVLFSRLDAITVSYLRRMAVRDGQLYFPVSFTAPTRLTISGAEPSLRVWDVTDHTRPQEVKVAVSGSSATFIAPEGTHEYVAFIPGKGGYQVTDPVNVQNQDLHSLNTPDMLIIAPYEYMGAANRLAEHHRQYDGFTVHVLQPEPIYNEFSSGTPDVGAFRRLLKMWYDRGALPAPDNGEPTGRIGYCLIMSRPTYDNKMVMEITKSAGYPRIPIWQSSSGTSKTSSYPCDDYIGMLDDSQEEKKFDLNSQKLRVAVGRMPVRSVTEANAMVKKYIDYVEDPSTGSWRNRMMLVADNCDHKDNNYNKFYHLQQTEEMLDKMLKTEDGRAFLVEKMYLDSYEEVMTQKGPTFPAAKERMLRLWNEGVSYINYIGHASTVEWTDEKLLEWSDIQNFSNPNLPFLYAATCEFARYDQDTQSGAEVLWSNPDGGIIATICPSRTVLISNNGNLSNAIGDVMFDPSTPGIGRRIGNIMIDGKNRITDNNRLRFIILGNPAMRFRIPELKVSVTSIAGIETGNPDAEMPVLKALGRSEIKGVITKADGTADTDFNGTIEIQLFDAEKAVETNPSIGTETNPGGQTRFYNNHTTLLYRGLAKVTGGQWSTTLLIPMEIENLYNPAKLSLYAYSDSGKEAHGVCTDFYVYGYDENAPDDDKGPEIHYFALNRPEFEDGDLVHTSPVVMAKISDESGINLSGLGIGHQITLTLDGRRYFDDVNTYYTPDNEDFTAGHILYPLPELEAGEHTLRLTVWDNANNSASADLTFNVAAAKRPEIYDLTTDVNPARDNVTFTLSTDRPMASVECRIEVMDLNGRRVWTSARTGTTDIHAGISVNWDLCTESGVRVPRGIYLYRATVTSPDGTSATRSRKLAVTAQ
ncbi:MAG: type IX secretion system sortase PorU [Muribaculaceae bacterium]|nr:type IX secretion system sortase PorU [Muribaculaceae bacterium]